MSAIGRVTASALAATNENTFGLANFNLDFSLVKVEAPIEYRGLRSALSRHRVENAEQGPQHRTARRLGALFEQILPPIKTLAEAYGRRSSQIAETEKQKTPVNIPADSQLIVQISLPEAGTGDHYFWRTSLTLLPDCFIQWPICAAHWPRWDFHLRCSYLRLQCYRCSPFGLSTCTDLVRPRGNCYLG